MKTVNLNIRITEEMRDEFKGIAESKAQTPSALVRMWIENYVKQNREESKMQTIEFEGKTYTLTQDAYINDGRQRQFVRALTLDDERPFYKAPATDQEGNEYEVYWDVRDNWKEILETNDESEMCDWDYPIDVENT